MKRLMMIAAVAAGLCVQPVFALLKGVSPAVSPELLKVLAEMGHGDEIVFSDAHFPGYQLNGNILRADGIGCDALLKAVSPLIVLDTYATPVVMMKAVEGDTLDPEVESKYRAALGYSGSIERIERQAFYERARKASAVVITGETAKYGNIIIKKGIVPVAVEKKAVAPIEPHPDTPAYDWKPVFAKDLSNAEFKSGAWAWDGDVLVSKLDNPIWSKEEYENFVFDFEYAMEPNGNSGAYIYLSHPDEFPKYKIEVQLLDDDSPKFKGKELSYQQTGSLYGRAPAKEVTSKKAGEWNRMTIFCQGKNVHVVHNGKAVTDANLDDWKDPLVNPDGTPIPPWHRGFPAMSQLPTRGRVGFQGVHGEAGIRIRNLRIASLVGGLDRAPMKLGCQLWGVKDFWYDNKDKIAAFAELFPKIKAMGYDGVQCGSFIRVDFDALEKILKENQLEVADQPIVFDDVEKPEAIAHTIEFCKRFNVKFVYIPYYKGKTADDWRAFCKRLDVAEAKLKPHGIRVGYHHHDHELTTKVDGELPWDILLAKDGARLELDVGPVLDAGFVPAEEIAKMNGRIPGIHAKPVGATAAGQPGERQDWAKILAASEKAGVEWFVIECEKRQNTCEDIEQSAKFLKPYVDLVNALR